MTALAALLLTVAGCALFFYAGYGEGQQYPPCYEDEVMAVQEDRNPAHGLTWACEALDDLIGRTR